MTTNTVWVKEVSGEPLKADNTGLRVDSTHVTADATKISPAITVWSPGGVVVVPLIPPPED